MPVSMTAILKAKVLSTALTVGPMRQRRQGKKCKAKKHEAKERIAIDDEHWGDQRRGEK